MTCPAILKNEIHEQYLLGHLKGSEIAEYENHLQQCESCQAEMENQRQLIFGLREIGRQEMKEEIRRQVEEQKTSESQIHWARLAKIAALLFMFVMAPSLFYIYRTKAPQIISVSSPVQTEILLDEEKNLVDADESVQQDKIEELKKILPPTTARESSVKSKSEGTAQLAVGKTIKKGDLKTNKTKDASPSKQRTQETSELEQFAVPAQIPDEVFSKPLKEQAAQTPNKQVLISEIERMQSLMTLTAADSVAPVIDRLEPGREFQLLEKNSEAEQSISRQTTDRITYHYDAQPARAKARSRRMYSGDNRGLSKTGSSAPYLELVFKSDGHVVQVHLKASVEALTKEALAPEKENQPPESFPVKILRHDFNTIEMAWNVGSTILEVEPAEISLEKLQDESIRVIIKDRYIYKIDLRNESTRAILEKEGK